MSKPTKVALGTFYVVLTLQEWRTLPIIFKEAVASKGFLIVYDSLEKLRKEYPHDDYITISAGVP